MNTATPWSRGRKILFRYIFVLFSLIVFPFPLTLIPGVSYGIGHFWTGIIGWTGNAVLGLGHDFSLTFTGSGDKLYDWVFYFTVLSLSLLVGTVWSVADRKRSDYERLQQWFLLFLTYYVAYYMFIYGIIKIFYLQFGPPNLERLFETFGQSSPMRLLWTFMGSSEAYTVFAGVCETVAGVFLLFRRTRTLGGLLTFGVMLNVFMLNMSYDVPVKLLSIQLMVMGLYIAAQDAKRLLNVFVLNKPASADTSPPLFPHKKEQRIVLSVQILLVGYIIATQIIGSIDRRKQYGTERAKSALYGVYNVETFVRNNDTLPPLATYSSRWKHLLMDYPYTTSVIMMDGSVRRYNSKIDTVAQKLIFTIPPDTVHKYELHYQRNGKDMHMAGRLITDSLRIVLENYPLENFVLLNRGFHWVNEVPYNRYNNNR